MESELRKLSQQELRQIRTWLDDVIEDELEFTPAFESSIRQAERDMAEGKSARVREPEGSWALPLRFTIKVSTQFSSSYRLHFGKEWNIELTKSVSSSHRILTTD